MGSQDHPSAPSSKNAVTVKYRDVTSGDWSVLAVPSSKAQTITLSVPHSRSAALQVACAMRRYAL
jgi:monoamine oxidase